MNYAKAKGIAIPESKEFEAIPGKGAKAEVNGKTVYVGSPGMLKDLNLKTNDQRILALQKAGKTVVFSGR